MAYLFRPVTPFPDAVKLSVSTEDKQQALEGQLRRMEDGEHPGSVWFLNRHGVQLGFVLTRETLDDRNNWKGNDFVVGSQCLQISVDAATPQEAAEKFLTEFKDRAQGETWRMPGAVPIALTVPTAQLNNPANWLQQP